MLAHPASPAVVAHFLRFVDNLLLPVDAADDGVLFVDVHADVAGFGGDSCYTLLKLGVVAAGWFTYRFGLVEVTDRSHNIPD